MYLTVHLLLMTLVISISKVINLWRMCEGYGSHFVSDYVCYRAICNVPLKYSVIRFLMAFELYALCGFSRKQRKEGEPRGGSLGSNVT
jgi:hypothetical protein